MRPVGAALTHVNKEVEKRMDGHGDAHCFFFQQCKHAHTQAQLLNTMFPLSLYKWCSKSRQHFTVN